MKELNQILKDLDNLSSNQSRKDYLLSICKNPNIKRHDLKRIACNILIENNFIEKYYRESFLVSLENLLLEKFSIFNKSLSFMRFSKM